MEYWLEGTSLTFEMLKKMNFKNTKQFSVISKLPQFYQQIILSYNKSKNIHKGVSNNDIIWGNQKFVINNKCLYFKHWIDAGINQIKDIKKENRLIHSDELLKRLSKKSNWISEWYLVKKAIQKSTIKTTIMYSKIPITSKDFYNIFLNQEKAKNYMTLFWFREFGIEDLKHAAIWEHTFEQKCKYIKKSKNKRI